MSYFESVDKIQVSTYGYDKTSEEIEFLHLLKNDKIIPTEYPEDKNEPNFTRLKYTEIKLWTSGLLTYTVTSSVLTPELAKKMLTDYKFYRNDLINNRRIDSLENKIEILQKQMNDIVERLEKS